MIIVTSILWDIGPLLGDDCEIGNNTVAVTRLRPVNNRGMVFSVQPVSRYYEQDKSIFEFSHKNRLLVQDGCQPVSEH
jgi:hypothetical protein